MSGRPELRVLRRSRGRARLHVPGLAGRERAVQTGVEAVPGVLAARPNGRTENLLVHFDPDVVDEGAVMAAAARSAPERKAGPAIEPGWLEFGGTLLLRRGVARCLAVVVDFERYPEWQRYITGVEVHERDAAGRGVLVEFRGVVGGRGSEREVAQLMRYAYPSPQRIAWRQERGPLSAAEGSWRFRAAGPGRTRISYRLRVKPGWGLSLLLRDERYEQLRDVLLEHAFGELRRRVELRAGV